MLSKYSLNNASGSVQYEAKMQAKYNASAASSMWRVLARLAQEAARVLLRLPDSEQIPVALWQHLHAAQ